jgi:hypothetical protein
MVWRGLKSDTVGLFVKKTQIDQRFRQIDYAGGAQSQVDREGVHTLDSLANRLEQGLPQTSGWRREMDTGRAWTRRFAQYDLQLLAIAGGFPPDPQGQTKAPCDGPSLGKKMRNHRARRRRDP